MAIRIDKGARTYLAYCTLCPWRGVTTTLEPVARRQGVAHEIDKHAGDHHARTAARVQAYRRRRHADHS